MNALAQRTLLFARSLIGIKELTGNNDGPYVQFIQIYSSLAMGQAADWMTGQPWCVMQAFFMIHVAAMSLRIQSIMPTFVGTSDVYDWANKNGKILPAPVDGCVGLLKNQDGNFVHCFLVEKVNDDGSINGIDGNEGNSICESHHDPSLCTFVQIC